MDRARGRRRVGAFGARSPFALERVPGPADLALAPLRVGPVPLAPAFSLLAMGGAAWTPAGLLRSPEGAVLLWGLSAFPLPLPIGLALGGGAAGAGGAGLVPRGRTLGLWLWAGATLAFGTEGARRLFRALAELAPSDLVEGPPTPSPGVNLLALTQRAPPEVVEGALRARAQAAKGTILLFPEGFFLRPGERGRPVWGRPPSVERLWAKRKLLLAAGVRVAIVRGKEPLHFL